MTNKLLEIKQTWIKENKDYLIGYGLPMEVIESIGDDIVKNAAQYAVAELEFAPDDMEQCCDNDTINSFDEAYSSKLDAYFAGHNAAIAAIIDRINQDVQSLNN